MHTTNFLVIARNFHKMGADEILQRFLPNFEWNSILVEAHGGVVGGHYAGKETTEKILRTGL